MSRFSAYTPFANPGLHVWREGTDARLSLRCLRPPASGWAEFEYGFDAGIPNDVRFMLFDHDADGGPREWEKEAHQRRLPRVDGGFAPHVWFVQDSARVLTADPTAAARDRVRIHLISRARYRPGELYVWDLVAGASRRVPEAGEDELGPVFDVDLAGPARSAFLFKFVRRSAPDRGFDAFEPDFANRLWSAADGLEVWTHSEAAEIAGVEPRMKTLRVHLRQGELPAAMMHVWQHNSDFVGDVDGVAGDPGWTTFEVPVYTGLGYGLLFVNPALPEASRWEHPGATREVRLSDDAERWALEGDPALFERAPAPDRNVELTIAVRPPGSALRGRLFAHVWINQARAPLHAVVAADARGWLAFRTFAGVTTSVRFYDEHGTWEDLARHALWIPAGMAAATRRSVVLGRPPLLDAAPPPDLFADPPFTIRRPGAYAEDGHLHFVVHAPRAARLRVVGEWTGWAHNPVEMRSTRDGTYWWARVPIAQVLAGLGRGDYHGAEYRLLVDDAELLQDPAAGWVAGSGNRAASRLLRSDRFQWTDAQWQRPGWEYLNVYQLHVARFTNRHPNDAPLRRVVRELEAPAGYLRELGVTAVLLLPVNEVGTHNSWGYDPAFFYAVEESYGGPDALKALVDACHRQGLAVLLDVVFNHAGTTDNILWSVAPESFFDGDTQWGAMVNFDHPQCRHFFAQNLVYLAREYHLDGFRLDHTATIVHSHLTDDWSRFVRVRGSGGGWDFLHALRRALHEQVDARCLLMAEHLPNEWSLTNIGGPMDTQWGDAFHDRMVDACRRNLTVMPRLADALKLSHAASDNWYGVTNYPESHDEVGNVRDRIAFVAGWGQGWRMAKVAAAGTLLARGIPMVFMGAESGEDRQFDFGGSAPLDLDAYQAGADRGRIRAWWRALGELRRGNAAIQGPAPLDVRLAEGQLLGFSRGGRGEYFTLLNFGGWTGHRSLADLNLPGGTYRELWNSTWPAFAIVAEAEDEHTNGGRDARLDRRGWLHVPDYGAVVLERVD